MQRRFSGRTTDRLEALEDRVLAPYAQRSAGATRRFAVDDPGRTLAYRTTFQRDRDRILHSLAFRRLKHKTQVYVPYEGDHHRTRLTHTLEVAQVGRTIARALGLCEDLVEAVALGHDLGQPPFGGAGEEVLSALLSGQESLEGVERQALAASGGFRPNYQSVRVVDRLEQRYDHPGLNLTDPVREGVFKCGRVDPGVEYPDWVEKGLRPEEPPTLETQVVRTADRLARLAHDLEDGIRAGEVALQAAERLRLGNAVVSKLGDRYRRLSRYRRQNALVRGMIHLLVSDVVVRAASLLEDWREGRHPGAFGPPPDGDDPPGPEGGSEGHEPTQGRPEEGQADDGQPGDPADGTRATDDTRVTAGTRATDGDQATGDARRAAGAPRGAPVEAPRLPAGTVGFSDRIGEMVDELESLVETQVYRSFAVSRLDARARTFIKGMFSAYYRDPLQLDDYVLLRYRSVAGGPFLRDLAGDKVQKEVASRYRGQPPFVRLIADHIAGMSDSFALKEYERLYLPFPEAEGH